MTETSIPQNPYIAGNPVGGSQAFVGRTDVLRAVLRVLKNNSENAIVLYGQRRIGKTSVLLELLECLPQEGPYQPVYFDLQDKASLPLNTVLGELVQRISEQFGTLLPNFDMDDLDESFKVDFLPAILNHLDIDTSLVLLFDEFDVLDNPGDAQAGVAFFPYLRSLLTLNPRLQFVFVIGRRPEDLSSLTLSIFKGVKSQQVSLLTKDDTLELVKLAEANGSLQWQGDALRYVYTLTGGHPFLTQQLCQEVWEMAWENYLEKIPQIEITSIDAAVSRTLQSATNALEWLWDGLKPAQRIIASALAEAGAAIISQDELAVYLQQSGVRILVGELQDAPRTLQDWDLLEPGGTGYRFRVELLRRWLVQNKPLARVQEELDYIQPAAENLFQAAYAFYQTGQLEEALPLLRRVVTLNPNHVRGSLMLSEILLAQRNLLESRQILEDLYKFHPAAARPRLVQTLLSQIEQTTDFKQRVNLYKRLISLEPHQIKRLIDDAIVFQNAGQFQQALLVLQPLIQLKPDHIKAVLLLAEILLAASQIDEAYDVLQNLYKSHPTVAHKLLIKALIAKSHKSTKDEQRLHFYEQILILDPQQEDAKKGKIQIWLHQLDVLEKNGKYNEALSLAREISAELPPDDKDQPNLYLIERKTQLSNLYQQGLNAVTVGGYSAAIQLFTQVINLEPTYLESTRYLHYAVTGTDCVQLESELSQVRSKLSQTLKELNDKDKVFNQITSELSQLRSKIINSNERYDKLEAELKKEKALRIKHKEEAAQLRIKLNQVRAQKAHQVVTSKNFWYHPPGSVTWSLFVVVVFLLFYIFALN